MNNDDQPTGGMPADDQGGMPVSDTPADDSQNSGTPAPTGGEEAPAAESDAQEGSEGGEENGTPAA